MHVHSDAAMRFMYFVILVGPILAIMLYSAVAVVLQWFDGLFDYTPYTEQKQHVTDGKDPVLRYTPAQRIDLSAPIGNTIGRVGLVAGEREVPPRPTFFGRLGGEHIETVGEYEEKVLSTWELKHWEKIKAQKLALETPIGAKIAKTLEKYGISEQNSPEEFEIIPKEHKKMRIWDATTKTWT